MSNHPKLPSFAQLAAQFQVVRVSTLLWLNEHKANTSGLAPIMLRITVDGTRIERSTGLRTTVPVRDAAGTIRQPGGWDVEGGCLRGKSKLVTIQNEQLELMKAHVRDLVNLMKATGRTVTAKSLRKQLTAPSIGKPLDFFALCEQQITAFYEQGNQATLATKRNALAALADWHGREASGQPRLLCLDDFGPAEAAQFYHWLLFTRKLKASSANNIVTNLATLFTYAVKMGEAEVWQHPFRLLKKKGRETALRTRLSVAQLATLREAPLTGELALARDIYLAQYYLHGSRVGAVLMLRWQNVQLGRVAFKAEKSGPYKSIAISPELERVLARYRPASPSPDALIFPLLPADFHTQTPAAQFKARHQALASLGHWLPKVAAAVGIEGRFHSHTARHTLALHAAEVGGIGVAQAMLGHADQKQTETYVGQLRGSVVEAAEAALYGAAAPPPAPEPTEGGRVVPMYRAA